jgi:hypothetical protein
MARALSLFLLCLVLASTTKAQETPKYQVFVGPSYAYEDLTDITSLTSTRTWRSSFPTSSVTAQAVVSSAHAKGSRLVRATSCAAASIRFWNHLESNDVVSMPSADSATPFCGITPPARTDFAISGWDGVALT